MASAGGRAVGEHFPQARAGLVQELLDGGLTGEAHGGEDTASSRQDLQVGLAFQAHLELAGTVAYPHQMGMRVDKTRHDHMA